MEWTFKKLIAKNLSKEDESKMSTHVFRIFTNVKQNKYKENHT